MTIPEIIAELNGMLIVNQKERQAIDEAVKILREYMWRDPELSVPEPCNFVLALLTGTVNGIECERAPFIVDWMADGDGWLLVNEEETEGDHWNVDKWMPIPWEENE